MKTGRERVSTVFGSMALLGAVLLGGMLASCAGKDPVGAQVAGALDAGFAAIRMDADLGILVRSDPTLAAAAGVQPISATAAAFSRETLDYHKRLIEVLKARSEGKTADTTLPPGPTSTPTTPPPAPPQ